MRAHSMCPSARAAKALKFTCNFWRHIADENRTWFGAKRSTLFSQTVSRTSFARGLAEQRGDDQASLDRNTREDKSLHSAATNNGNCHENGFQPQQVRTWKGEKKKCLMMKTQDNPDRWSLDCISLECCEGRWG